MASRKSPGEGGVYQRADGLWLGYVILPDGKRQYVSSKKKSEAIRKRAELKRRVDGGLLPDKGRESTGDYLAAWLETLKPPASPISTYRTYESLVRTRIAPGLGAVPLARLTPERLESFYAELRAAGLAPRTVRLAHAILHRALGRAVKHRRLVSNPADLVEVPGGTEHRPRAFSAAQARRFLAAIRGDPLEALYLLAITTGKRQSELLGLRWSALDLDRRRGAIAHKLQQLNLELEPPKTKASRRAIALAPLAVDALRRHRTRQLEDRLRAGAAWRTRITVAGREEDNDLVFTRPDGAPLNGRTVTQARLKPLLARAGLPDLTFHELRHSVATLLAELDTHPAVIAAVLGHASTAMAMEGYIHVDTRLQEGAMMALEGLLTAVEDASEGEVAPGKAP